MAYIVFEGPEEERNMNTLVEMINSMEVREDDETFKNAVDYKQSTPDRVARLLGQMQFPSAPNIH